MTRPFRGLALTATRRLVYNGTLYGEYMGEFNVRTMEMIQGDLPKRAQELVTEWMKKHQEELQKMWDSQKIEKLPPLL